MFIFVHRKAQQLIDILAEANQEVPEELLAMAERFQVWKEKRDKEREELGERRGDYGGRRGGRGGGRRRDDNFGSFW